MMPEGRWLPGTMIPEHVEPSEQSPAAATDYERGVAHGRIDALEHVVEVLGEDTPPIVRELLESAQRQAAARGIK